MTLTLRRRRLLIPLIVIRSPRSHPRRSTCWLHHRSSTSPAGRVRTARLVVALAVAAGLLLRLVFSLGYWVDKPLTQDEREYLVLARSLAEGTGLRYPAGPGNLPAEHFSRAPAYPAFLAVVGGDAITTAPFTSSPASVKIAQSLVGAVGVLLVAILAWRLGGPIAGAIAAVLAAGYPPLVWISAYVLSEAIYSTLGLLTVLTLSAVTDRPDTPTPTRRATVLTFVSGGLAGCAALTRPVGLAFLGLATLWLVARRRPWLAGALVLGALLVVAPWTARNVREHGRLIIVSAQGGVNFWLGNHPEAVGEGDMSTNPALARANLELQRRHSGLTAEELEPIYYREALGHVMEHPLSWLTLLVRKFFYLWVPIGPSYTFRSTPYLWASVLSYGLVFGFAVAGAVCLWRARRIPVALGLMAGSVVVTSVLFFPGERFRIPILDPTFIICASVWGADRRAVLSRLRS